MGNKKIDPGDTIDTATHFFHRLQAEGWTLTQFNHELEYSESATGQKLLVGSTVTVKMIPRWG